MFWVVKMEKNKKSQITDIIVFIILFHLALLISNFFMDKYGKTWKTLYIPSVVVVCSGLIIWYIVKQIKGNK